jgi:hypothetical protein
MPMYVHAAFTSTTACLVAALLAPAPRVRVERVAACCRMLLAGGAVALVAAVVLPAFDVWYPSLAVLGGAVGLWLIMFWLAKEPTAARSLRTDDRQDEDGGGGGGSEPPTRGPEPPAPGGVDWDAFDAERRAWDRQVEPLCGSLAR